MRKTEVLNIKNSVQWTSPAVQWLRLHLPMQGARVQPLVEELRSHVSHGVGKNLNNNNNKKKHNKKTQNGVQDLAES